ncbi:MAG: addiction module protein [Candidatus Tectomicrobia bacterium]|nr:addiction module protein [Candidatus Tectomicrobia bacterium]
MASVIAEIEEKFRSLSDGEKAEVLRSLLAELDGPADAGAEGAWLEEARKRHRELAEGKAEPVPAGRVFENLRSRIPS